MPNQTTSKYRLLMRQIIWIVIFSCVILKLFAYIYPTSRSIVLKDPFLLSHTLDFLYEPDRNYQSWTAADWNNWHIQREPLHRHATNTLKIRRKFALDGKPINTVIIATPAEITEAFAGTLEQCGDEFVWSNKMFITYELIRRPNGSFIVYRCPPTFIAVRLINGKPAHLHGHSEHKTRGQNINFSRKRCVVIN